MSFWKQTGQQGQNMSGGGLGNSSLTGLGSGYYPAQQAMVDNEKESLREMVHQLQTELKGQQSIRAMDQVLLRRHYRIWQWLKDVHPEVITEFEAMEDLLKASGEKF